MADLRPVTRHYVPFPPFSSWATSSEASPLVDRFRTRFAEIRERSSDGGAALRERATRWAAIDTGAIEGLYEVDRGFTISVAANVALLEAIRTVKGEEVQRAVGDALAAYEFVLDLATRRELITEIAIRELHRVVCRSQDEYKVTTAIGLQSQPLPKGVYKLQDNFPLNLASNEIHAYASVMDTPAEMGRLIDELRSPAFAEASPVQQAAYSHFAFVSVHPFSDGNGRVARALASVFLYRDPGLPLVVFDDEKPEYLAALEAADDGRFQPLVSFVGNRLIDTVNLLADLQDTGLPPVAEQAAEFARSLNGREGRTHVEVDAGAARLLEALGEALRETVGASGINSPLSATVDRTVGGYWPQLPTGFRSAPDGSAVVLSLASAAPATAKTQATFRVAIPRGLEGDADYLVHVSSGQRLEIFLREAHPRVTGSLRLRLQGFADQVLRAELAHLTGAARETLRTDGYV